LLEEAAGKETGALRARRWRQAYSVHWFLGNHQQAIDCLARAVTETPNDYSLRYTFASVLYSQHQYDRACQNFQWCARRKPHDRAIRQKVRDARARMAPATMARVN
jgi:tetratricopeptide (TPR) repeat protein